MISEFFADGMIPWSPILLSLKVAGLATAASFCAGVAAAWLLARRRSPFSAVLDAMCTLPMILPPTVLGYYLILLVGRRGVIGPWLAECGINLIFSWQGAVVAATVVVFPLIYKSARAALELVDPRLENAARTLGASGVEGLLAGVSASGVAAASSPGGCWPLRVAWASSARR